MIRYELPKSKADPGAVRPQPWRATDGTRGVAYVAFLGEYLPEHDVLIGAEALDDSSVITTELRDSIDGVQTSDDCGFDLVVFQNFDLDRTAFYDGVQSDVMPSFS